MKQHFERGENAHDERHRDSQVRAEYNPKRKGIVLAKRFGDVKDRVLNNAEKALKLHQIMAKKERKEAGKPKMEKQFGTFEQRLNKLAKNK